MARRVTQPEVSASMGGDLQLARTFALFQKERCNRLTCTSWPPWAGKVPRDVQPYEAAGPMGIQAGFPRLAGVG